MSEPSQSEFTSQEPLAPEAREILLMSSIMNPMKKKTWSKREPTGFVSATGEKAAILGRESGPFEVWTWPIKVLHDLSIQIQGSSDSRSTDALTYPGDSLVEPGRFALRCAHPALTLTLRSGAARDEPLVVLALDLDCDRDATVSLSFRPSFLPMWPAGWGARVLVEDEDTGALFLSEEQGRHGSMVGWTDHPIHGIADHGMPDHDLVCGRSLKGGSQQTLYFVVAGARGEDRSNDAIAIQDAALGRSRLDDLTAKARALFKQAANDPESFLAAAERERDPDRPAALVIHDPVIQRAYDGAIQVIESSRVDIDGVGSGIVAGYAPAGAGNRPGFGWLFDGDAMCAAEALSLAGAHAQASRIFREAAGRQREDGKVMHELSLSAGLCDWQNDYPYAYYKAENTGAFLALLDRHVARSGDNDLAKELADNVQRALDYLLACSKDGLFLLEKGGLGCVEAGPLCGTLTAEAYCQGLFVAGARGAAKLLLLAGRADAEARADQIAKEADDAFHAAFFDASDQRYRFGLRPDGERVEPTSAYLGLPFSFGVGDSEVAKRTVEAQNAPGIAADWGLRMFDRDSEHYDPAHYNTGAVFPFLNGFVVRAMYDHGHHEAAWQLLNSQLALTDFSGAGLVPEHVLGERAVEPERGVPHQAFSSAMIIQGLLAGKLGLGSDEDGSLVVALSMTPALSDTQLRGLEHRGHRFDLDVSVHKQRSSVGRETHLCVTVTWEGKKDQDDYRHGHLRTMIRDLGPDGLPDQLRDVAKKLSLIGQPGLDLHVEEEARQRVTDSKDGAEPPTENPDDESGIRDVVWAEKLPPLSIVHERRVTGNTLLLQYSAGPHLNLRQLGTIQKGSRSEAPRLVRTETRGDSRIWTLSAPTPGPRRIHWSSDRPVRFEGAEEVNSQSVLVNFPEPDGDSDTNHPYPAIQLTAHICEEDERA